MDNYIQQLIQDIQQATIDLPKVYPYHIDHPTEEGMEWTPELVHTSYKTIAAWTGIPTEVFPSSDKLTDEHKQKLVEAIGHLWDAYLFSFNIDKEDVMNADLHYRMYLDCWEDLVQYLPESGFDIELCAGEPMGCRMDEECFCLFDDSIEWELDESEFEAGDSSFEWEDDDSDINDLPF